MTVVAIRVFSDKLPSGRVLVRLDEEGTPNQLRRRAIAKAFKENGLPVPDGAVEVHTMIARGYD